MLIRQGKLKIVYKCIDKALCMGIDAALHDLPHGSESIISEEAKAWVIHLACCKPKDMGYAAELWTMKALAEHVRKDAVNKGYLFLSKAAKATIHRILIARVERKHRSIEFIALLKDMDEYYPKGSVIRIILDNHSSHVSKETRAFLATVPNRFNYVHTPKHGSWLNLVETLFGKMARTFLRGMRVNSWNELKERILLGIAEINNSPFVHRWKKFDVLER